MDMTYAFDIDVDVSGVLGAPAGSALLDSRWYEIAHPRRGRDPIVQHKIDQLFHNNLLYLQWEATARRRLDRRRALRAPILATVQPQSGNRLVAYDISMRGLGCAGTPTAPIMRVEFRVPQLPFPVDTRVEVVQFQDSNVTPLCGVRFIDLDQPYVDSIARYIERRRRQMRPAA